MKKNALNKKKSAFNALECGRYEFYSTNEKASWICKSEKKSFEKKASLTSAQLCYIVVDVMRVGEKGRGLKREDVEGKVENF